MNRDKIGFKCCANCEWSISPEEEREIMEEQGYAEGDPERTHVGDCCLGMKDDNPLICSCDKHSYIEGTEVYKNYVYYDEQYFGPGYLIISTLDEEIVKFLKISAIGEGFPIFSIRGVEKNSEFNVDKPYRKIEIISNKGEVLYKAIHNLANWLNHQKIRSIDPSSQGQSFLEASSWTNGEANLSLYQDVMRVKYPSDEIDIQLGDDSSCENYPGILNFYYELKNMSIGEYKDIEQLLALKLKNK